jgi:NADPH-ferrihemoprotein reductase
MLELLPRLQARYYSISSSPKINNEIVSVTAVVLQYKIGDRLIKGVCTNYLADKEENSTSPIFVRKSTLRLPHRHNIPVILIGPGTGFAPFRGFIQERTWHKEQGKDVGEMLLFFGCRHPDHDHIYKKEMDEWVRLGVLTRCHVAYSRVANEKVYVQHQLWIERDHVWSIIQRGGNIYVCGYEFLSLRLD